MKPFRLATALALACVVASLTGCASPARIDQMVIPATRVSGVAVPAHLKGNVAIRDVTGGGDTNPLWLSNVGSADFDRALEASLRATGMLQPNRQAGDFYLTAHLEKLERPIIGASLTVTATVSYTLTRRANGRDVYRSTLTTPYTAAFSEAFLFVERQKMANEGAIRENIGRLVEELSRVRPD